MAHDLDKLKAYLNEIGLSDVQHTHDDLLSHLLGVYHLLRQWQCPEHVALAGLFHSLYGTEGFPRQSVPLSKRDEVKALIGERAEGLVYAYCAMSYDSLQESVHEGKADLTDRFTGQPMELSEEAFQEVLQVKLADTFEQASEKIWQSRFFRRIAKRLDPVWEQRWEEEKSRYAEKQARVGV